MPYLRFLTSLLLAAAYLSPTASEAVTDETLRFTNAYWFDGERFERRDWYVENGRFIAEAPQEVDRTIDLEGGYVIPPFAEAHTHNLESDWQLDERIAAYVRDGVFYAKMQSAIHKRVDTLRERLEASPIDIAYAYAPLTGSGGHPVSLRETFFDRGYFEGLFESKEDIAGHGYFIIDTENELEEKWPRIMAAEPDFIKTVLIHSEEYDKRKDDPDYFGQRGLNPELLPIIVDKAHADGLRVSVHVDSAADFRIAVEADADEINHMPGRRTIEVISPELAALAARSNVVVVTTASLIRQLEEKDPERYQEIREVMIRNLRTLRDAGVELAVGSDIWDDNSVEEAFYLHDMNIFDNLELLHMWTRHSATTTFPDRKIGVIYGGFEASFLVLAGNPADDFSVLRDIRLRYKQGEFIPVPE